MAHSDAGEEPDEMVSKAVGEDGYHIGGRAGGNASLPSTTRREAVERNVRECLFYQRVSGVNYHCRVVLTHLRNL